MSDDVSLEEVIATGVESRLIDLHTAMPARVESYSASANTVTVTPMLNRQLPTDDGDYVAEALPQIPDVKIAWPRAGGFAITFPIQKGDYVLLVFCEASLAAWRQNGQQGDPGDPERHGLSGAIAIPGVFPDSQNIASPSTSNMVLGKIGTPAAQIEITPSEVHVGAGATDFIALASKVNANISALWNLLNGVFGAASSPLVVGAVGGPDTVYTAMKAAIAAAVIATSLPPADVAAASSRAK